MMQRYLWLFIMLFASMSWAQERRRPNILFAIADDASWSHFSAYGSKFARTPNFDRAAREGRCLAIALRRCRSVRRRARRY